MSSFCSYSYSYSASISHNGIIDAEVRELELEVTSLRKRRCLLEKALVKAHKEIARLQKELRAYEGAR